MKFTTIYLEGNKIEVFNSIFGVETIKVNDEQVSSKFSFFGTEHIFKIKDKGREVECRLTTRFEWNVLVIDLYKDDKPVIQSEKIGCIRGVIIVTILGLIYLVIKRYSV